MQSTLLLKKTIIEFGRLTKACIAGSIIICAFPFLSLTRRHNAAYKEALAFHGAGTPHSEAWASAKQLYDAVISDE